MNDHWELRVYHEKQLVHTLELVGPALLGRQNADTEKLYSAAAFKGQNRIVIASRDDTAVSRLHALVEPLAEGGFRITNKSENRPIDLFDGKPLAPAASRVVANNAMVRIGQKTFRFLLATAEHLSLQGLGGATLPPGQSLPLNQGVSLRSLSQSPIGLNLKDALRWLQVTLDVFQAAAGSADFFAMAAQAVVQLVNLDAGQVLLLHQGEWRPQSLAQDPQAGEVGRLFSRSVLNRVLQEKKTFRGSPRAVLADAESVRQVAAVVAAPILDRHGNVIGALYGDRRQREGAAGTEEISELEATLVEVLARGVAAGLARLEQEQALAASRVQFEQFFTPELARQLLLQPDLLEGRDTEVSLLFCDIRGFSRISEHLGPARTVQWISSVMGALSDCVRSHKGVLVDYIGDELFAMWGAPEEQPDHASLACQAALDMLAQLPRLNESWQPILGEPMDLGIGINTGVARVGNTGSHHKLKYGPLGNSVNLASRVQGATKHVKCRLLITGATRQRLKDSFATRRLCQVQVVNIAEPVTLYELAPRGSRIGPRGSRFMSKPWPILKNGSLAGPPGRWAVGVFRIRKTSRRCCCSIAPLERWVEGATPGHPVWRLAGK